MITLRRADGTSITLEGYDARGVATELRRKKRAEQLARREDAILSGRPKRRATGPRPYARRLPDVFRPAIALRRGERVFSTPGAYVPKVFEHHPFAFVHSEDDAPPRIEPRPGDSVLWSNGTLVGASEEPIR